MSTDATMALLVMLPLVAAIGAGMGGADWSELPALMERQADLRFELAPEK